MQSGRRRAAGAPPHVPSQCAAAQGLRPHDGLRRCAAAPGLLLGLVVIELVLVALQPTDMAAKIALADVVAVKGGTLFRMGVWMRGKLKNAQKTPAAEGGSNDACSARTPY